MTTRQQQIAALVKFLDSPEREGMQLEDIATKIVNDFYKLLLAPVKDMPPRLGPGVTFKSILTNKVHHVAWSEGDLHWIISADSRYGYLGKLDPWRPYALETKAKSGEPGHNPEWEAGDTVGWLRRGWGKGTSVVLATADKCVLLRTEEGAIQPEPNDSMKKFYKKIPKGLFDS